MATDLARRTAAGPRRQVLADGTYGAIKAMILDHEIAPGEHVGIDELARDLSVSQTPVREALARLESDGLVTKIPLRGYEATNLLSVQQFDELFHFRTLIEPWAAAEASHRSTRLEIEAIKAELDRAQRGSIDPETATYASFIEHDTRFHTLVAKASGNPFVEDAFIRTHCHLHLFRVYKAAMSEDQDRRSDASFVRNMFEEYYSAGRFPLALTEHAEIAAAIAGGRADTARDLMLDHIESSRLRFIPAVEALNARG
ncbi:GntR family transcriptional regulator [Diaminobutyricibacter sp. McL0608]|uniref:GntR family transcriptional regulator n=1 Tax=Leifsonia sp. McL0608 TaxID=3143537 RepID=UPI0031F313FC